MPNPDLIARCQDIPGLRQWVQTHTPLSSLPASAPAGQHWLPIIWTARGPLYGEAIAATGSHTYRQPYPLSDRQRQPLYRSAFWLLDHLGATPGVYLMQISIDPLQFDRLIPFPDRPAIASIGVQEPDLFACHWRCITGQPFTTPILTQSENPLDKGAAF
ncbi:MAG TPA: hypothetical protein DCQ32_09245 [Cyanobacteria bacterium UBA8156]|jgi:hypothetical protein|nr:hypothetical protein [Cyanobacteria bacterium UBA8156]